ncbi:hypothetical protein [Sciscionella sediminilitoris]|uniref:hypothetical protein n=1 Tax=Sciscionella sediminilitoris TaxID=1445613 RepID=UPI00055BE625|nr:hypothetical protein [Sciscionella sp. SE31]
MVETLTSDDSRTQVRRRPGIRHAWWLPVAVAVLSALVFAVAEPTLIDDTYITLSYARNIAFHGHWGLIQDSVANSATSPLNVLLLAALTFVFRNAVVAAGALFVITQVTLALALRAAGRHAGLPERFAPLAILLLTVNPLMLSSLGMEVSLGAAVLAWALVFVLRHKPLALGATLGLLSLIRLDLLVLGAVLVLVRPRFWRGLGRTVLATIVVALPWYLLSWFLLGSAVPDTLIIKTMQGTWGKWGFGNGPLLYLQAFPKATVLSFLPVALGVLAGLIWLALAVRRGPTWSGLRPFAVLLLAGAVHYVAYSMLIVPPYHWYYGPSMSAGIIFLAAALCAVRGPLGWIGTGIGGLLVAASVVWYTAHGLPRTYAPIMTNWTSTAEYRKIGRELHSIVGDRPVRSGGEIGVLAYSCDCAVVDEFADRGIMLGEIDKARSKSSGLGKTLQDINFTFLDRSVRPLRPEYALGATLSAHAPAGAIKSWPIGSPWAKYKVLYLLRQH